MKKPTIEAQALVVETFAKIARPIMRKWMPAASCIGSARVTIETMRVFCLEACEIAVSFALQVPSAKYARVSGFTESEREEMRRHADNFRDDRPVPGPSWNGHLLVLVENRWLLDPSIDQASAPAEFGVTIGPEVFVIDTAGHQWRPEDFQIRCGVVLDNGALGTVDYSRIDDRSYLESEAWNDEGLPFLADQIAMQMTVSEMWRQRFARK